MRKEPEGTWEILVGAACIVGALVLVVAVPLVLAAFSAAIIPEGVDGEIVFAVALGVIAAFVALISTAMKRAAAIWQRRHGG